MLKKNFIFICVFALLLALNSEPAYADSIGLIFRGVAKTITAAFEIPKAMLMDSTEVMFPFGLVTGAVSGAFRTVGGVLSGAYDMARGAAPYAKYLVFLTRI